MKALQIGLDWFPERAGGLPRFYYDFVSHASHSDLSIKGVVAGSASISESTGGLVTPLASNEASLFERLRGARRVIRTLNSSYQPDVIATHFALYTLPAIDFLDKPIVVHFHGPWAYESGVEGASRLKKGVKYYFEKLVYSRANRFIVLSQAFADILNKNYGISYDIIHIVPGGVDLEKFNTSLSREESRATLNLPIDGLIVVAIRRLVRRMGLENLIRAMPEVIKKHPNLLLLIGGKGPLKEELNGIIRDLGLQNNVRLLGYVSDEDLPNFYRAADLTVVPSVALEGFGLIAAESLACGTPAFVTPVGGLPDVVSSLDPKLVFDGTTSSDITSRLLQVADRTVSLPSRSQCRVFSEERFSWAKAINDISDVYRLAVLDKQ